MLSWAAVISAVMSGEPKAKARKRDLGARKVEVDAGIFRLADSIKGSSVMGCGSKYSNFLASSSAWSRSRGFREPDRAPFHDSICGSNEIEENRRVRIERLAQHGIDPVIDAAIRVVLDAAFGDSHRRWVAAGLLQRLHKSPERPMVTCFTELAWPTGPIDMNGLPW